MIEFDYKKYIRHSPAGEIITSFRPNAKVTLINGDIAKSFNLLVDSGADITLLPKNIGESIGLHIKEDENITDIGGIGGQVPMVYRYIDVQIGEYRIKTKVAWALVDNIPPLLGREDIFDNFHIEFRQDEKKLRFRRI